MKAEVAASKFPAFVTDGHHIYIWNDEYEPLLKDGRLKESDPPPPRAEKKLSSREVQELATLRQKAIDDAEKALKLFGAAPKPG